MSMKKTRIFLAVLLAAFIGFQACGPKAQEPQDGGTFPTPGKYGATIDAQIKFRRGLASALPTLAAGEPGFTTDTRELYVGSSVGNIRVHGDYITPEMYGAKGDGTTDDTAAIQASVNAVADGGAWMGVGDYKTTSLITIQDLERATFTFGGKIINTASSVLKLDDLVRCKIDGLAISCNPYDWSPAHTGLEISGKFWNNSVE